MKYILVKDLPDLKAGAVFDTSGQRNSNYYHVSPDTEKTWEYTPEVIGVSDFFKPYDEPLSIVPRPEPNQRGRGANNPYCYEVRLTRHVTQADIERVIQAAIEKGDLESDDNIEVTNNQ